MKKYYKYLNEINFPSDLRKLKKSDLKNVAREVREEMISAVSETGGHLGAGLGVVELTVALHYVFIYLSCIAYKIFKFFCIFYILIIF